MVIISSSSGGAFLIMECFGNIVGEFPNVFVMAKELRAGKDVSVTFSNFIFKDTASYICVFNSYSYVKFNWNSFLI